MGWRDTVSDVQSRARRLAESVGQEPSGEAEPLPAPQGGAMRVTRLPLRDVDLQELADALARWYRSQSLEAEVARDDPGVRVQCRGHNARAIAGAAIALTVVLRQERDGFAVEVGAGKWVDKGVAAGVGLLTLGSGVGLIPLASSVWGGWQQAKLPARTIEFIQATAPSYVRRPSPQPPAAAAGQAVPQAGRGPALDDAPPVDVNTASLVDLQDLAGLPRAAAEHLVAERSRRRGFTDVGEVQDVLQGHLPPHLLVTARRTLVVRGASRPQRPGTADVPRAVREPGARSRGVRRLDLDGPSEPGVR